VAIVVIGSLTFIASGGAPARLSPTTQIGAAPLRCPLWVKSGHLHCNGPCPLYTRKRAFS